MLEADAVLVNFAPVTGGDAIYHLGRVEGPGHVAGPLLAFEQPLQQEAVDLIGIDESPFLIYRADAVRVTVGGKAGLAVVFQHRNLQRPDMGRYRLWLNAGKERIPFRPYLDVVNAHAGEDAGEDAPPGAVHAVNGVFLPGRGDPLEVSEGRDGLDIRAKKVSLGNAAAGSGHGQP